MYDKPNSENYVPPTVQRVNSLNYSQMTRNKLFSLLEDQRYFKEWSILTIFKNTLLLNQKFSAVFFITVIICFIIALYPLFSFLNNLVDLLKTPWDY